LKIKKTIMKKNPVNFLLGLVAGAVAGAALGMLLAPKNGQETRNLITSKIDEFAKKGKEIYESKKQKNTTDVE